MDVGLPLYRLLCLTCSYNHWVTWTELTSPPLAFPGGFPADSLHTQGSIHVILSWGTSYCCLASFITLLRIWIQGCDVNPTQRRKANTRKVHFHPLSSPTTIPSLQFKSLTDATQLWEPAPWRQPLQEFTELSVRLIWIHGADSVIKSG